MSANWRRIGRAVDCHECGIRPSPTDGVASNLSGCGLDDNEAGSDRSKIIINVTGRSHAYRRLTDHSGISGPYSYAIQ